MKIYSLFRLILLTVCLSFALFLTGCVMTWSSKSSNPEQSHREAITDVANFEAYLQEKRRWLEEGKFRPEDVEYEKEQLRKGEEDLNQMKKEYNLQ